MFKPRQAMFLTFYNACSLDICCVRSIWSILTICCELTPNQMFIFVTQLTQNITTNEMANALRYGYLRGSDGRFRNPYNHGCRKNCLDFFIKGYTDDDEIAWPALQQVSS